MEHKFFRILYGIILIITITITILYCYFLENNFPEIVIITLKIMPIFIMIMTIFLYYFIYRINLYALLIQAGLTFCNIGDILLICNDYSHDMSFFIVGGTCFIIGRIYMSFGFTLYPYHHSNQDIQFYNNNKNINLTKNIISLGLPLMHTITMFVYFIRSVKNYMCEFLCVYVVVMNLHLYTSTIRIRMYSIESSYSAFFGFFGTLLFNISDTLLLWNIFVNHIKYSNFLPICFYWIGMYFITISIIRGNTTELEKNP